MTAARAGLLLALLAAAALPPLAAALRGWNDAIPWVEAGAFAPQDDGKPIMYLFHKSWCGACKNLKRALNDNGRDSEKVVEFSKHFHMVNVEDDEGNAFGDAFAPDGGYIPRVIFAKSDGTPIKHLKNDGGNPKFKYFYSHPLEVHRAMRNALDELTPDWRAAKSEL